MMYMMKKMSVVMCSLCLGCVYILLIITVLLCASAKRLQILFYITLQKMVDTNPRGCFSHYTRVS